jgi:hypothetical protein
MGEVLQKTQRRGVGTRTKTVAVKRRRGAVGGRPGRPPKLTARSFLVCQAVRREPGSGTFVVIGPLSEVRAPSFPHRARVAVFAEATGLFGDYSSWLELREATGRSVWKGAEGSVLSFDPQWVATFSQPAVEMNVPKAGFYEVVLVMNGKRVAGLPLTFGLQGTGGACA